MSAQLASAHASFSYGTASINLSMGSPEELIAALAKFGIQTPANDTPARSPHGASTSKPDPKADKPAAQPEGNAPASTGTQASAPPAAGGSAAAGETVTHTYTYDHVKDRVLKLSKVKRELAIEVLGAFKTVGGDKVDHGNKLQLPDYPAFIAAADAKLAAAGVKA